MRYNGWSNWATWNVNLWIMNDQWIYGEFVRASCCNGGKWNSAHAKDFVFDMFPDGTPDMDGARDLLDVDYEELANNWTE